MKEHYCPIENTLLTYENQCNWCGEKEESMTQEALRMALEAFYQIFESTPPYRDDGTCVINDKSVVLSNKAIAAIKEALAQERTWVGLEGEDIRNLWEEATKLNRSTMTMITSFARAIEAKLKDKNCVG